MTLLRQEASCFCEAKVSPVALSIIPVTVNWLSDKRYLCVRINYQAGSFSRQSKSRYDRRLSLEKPEVYSSTNQNLLHTIEVCSIINIKKVLPIDG